MSYTLCTTSLVDIEDPHRAIYGRAQDAAEAAKRLAAAGVANVQIINEGSIHRTETQWETLVYLQEFRENR
jgi:hypothetical protein